MAQRIEVGRAIGTPCQGCNAPVWFVKHEKSGKPAPLVYPPDGVKPNIVAYEQDGEWLYHVVSKKNSFAFSEHQPEFISHYVNCPNAAQFRPKERQ